MSSFFLAVPSDFDDSATLWKIKLSFHFSLSLCSSTTLTIKELTELLASGVTVSVVAVSASIDMVETDASILSR